MKKRLRSSWIYKRIDSFPSFRDFNKVWVGLISALVILAFTAFAYSVGTLGLLTPTYSMSGVFTNTGGMKVGREVRVAGVKAGKVTGITPDFDKGQVIITWKVNRGVRLGSKTKAEIVNANFLGGHYLRLSGPVKAPYMDELLSGERRIPLERTRTPFSLIDALGTTVRKVQAIDIEAVNRIVNEFADATEKTGPAFGELVTNLAKVTAAVNERDAELRRLVTNSQQITTTLAAKDAELFQLIDAADVLLTTLDQRRVELGTVLGSSSRVVTKLADLVAGQRGQLNALIGDFHTIIEAAGRQLPAINTGLAWTGPTFAGLASVGKHGPWADVVVYGLGLVNEETLCTVPVFPGCAP